MIPPINPGPDNPPKRKQRVTPGEIRRRLLEQGYPEQQAQKIVDSDLKTQSGHPWTYAGIGLLLWVFGVFVRVNVPGMGPLTLISDIAGIVFFVMAIRSALPGK